MSLLAVHELTAFYGDFQALFGISVDIAEGEVAAIIGSNGAGKSTFLKSIVGLVRGDPEAVRFDGRPIGHLQTSEIVRLGIGLVPEGRRIFPSLSVEENLLVGGRRARPGTWTLKRIYELFPGLAERRTAPGDVLSGGQQQMLAIGRALMANPRLVMFDEISLGLAPIVVRELYQKMPEICRSGTTVLLVEQDIAQALRIADRVYCFREGRLVLVGPAGSLDRQQISAAYFGI